MKILTTFILEILSFLISNIITFFYNVYYKKEKVNNSNVLEQDNTKNKKRSILELINIKKRLQSKNSNK